MEILAETTRKMKHQGTRRGVPRRQADRQGGSRSGTQLDAEPAKRLADALAAAWPDFQVIYVNEARGTAKGIIPTESGYGPVATLGFTHETGLLRIDVKLGRPIESGLPALLELPFQTRWTRTMCGRDRIAWLRAATKCENVGTAGPAIRALACDLRDAHQNELLSRAMGDEWASEYQRQGGAV